MEKIMRNAPSLIVFVVLVMQTDRVSDFGFRIGAGWLAVVFAVFLSISTFTLSYFQARTQNYTITADKDKDRKAYNMQFKISELYKDVHGTATFWLVLFVLIEGLLNLAETMSHLGNTVEVLSWEWFGAMVYGAFPTLAAFGFGNLQALVDRMPHGVGNASGLARIFNAFMRRMENALDADTNYANAYETHKTHDAPKVKRNANAYPKPCPHCGAPQPNANAYSAHIRWKHGTQAASQIGFVAQPVNKTTTTTPVEAVETVDSVK